MNIATGARPDDDNWAAGMIRHEVVEGRDEPRLKWVPTARPVGLFRMVPADRLYDDEQ